MENKQTAVEYLIEELRNYIISNISDVKLHVLIETALAMEKEQLYNFVDFINERHFNSFKISKDEVEQYHNEKFKSE